MDMDPIDGLLAEGNEINFYRIVQECLNNMVKHSGAETGIIELKRLGHRLRPGGRRAQGIHQQFRQGGRRGPVAVDFIAHRGGRRGDLFSA